MEDDKEVEVVETEKLEINKKIQNAGTYSFHGEDHTLGNLLRTLLVKDPDVSFSGYSVPHPSEEIMNVRIQTFSKDTDKVLINNLNNITLISDVLKQKFETSLKQYNKNHNINKS